MSSPLEENAAMVLEDAAVLIETYGWVQGSLHTQDGMCAVGAIRMANGHIYAKRVAEQALAQNVKASLRENFLMCVLPSQHIIFEWNDNQAQTRQEILDTLQGVAKQLRTEGLPVFRDTDVDVFEPVKFDF